VHCIAPASSSKSRAVKLLPSCLVDIVAGLDWYAGAGCFFVCGRQGWVVVVVLQAGIDAGGSFERDEEGARGVRFM